ncbi:MAG: Gfo/Idh/MocA family oxidoreductase [Chloroflexota bacterium]
MTATEGRVRYADGTKLRTLKLGMIGVGVGGTEMLPPMDAMEELDVMACADVNAEIRANFKQRYPEAHVYDSVEGLCKDPDVEVVWISSPNRFHAEHAIIAAQHGKHIVVEKPMALSMQQAEEMVEAAEKAGVYLLAGHTRSFTLPIRTMRKVIQSGEVGDLRAMTLVAYSDWMLRPRTADELDVNQGGGMVYRQGPHQIDTVRVLGGGMLRSVRAYAGQWMPERSIPGYYSAFMEFENGQPVTITHDGYGYFMGSEMVQWGHANQRYTPEERVEVRRQMRTGSRNENQDKQDIRIGGSKERTVFRPAHSDRVQWVPEDLGIVIVSCDRGDLRHSPYGVYVYSDAGQREIDLTPDRFMGGAGQRRAELEEIYDAVVFGKPLWHDGRWGMATLEVVLAIIESSRERKEVMLTHQVPLPADYDAEFTL